MILNEQTRDNFYTELCTNCEYETKRYIRSSEMNEKQCKWDISQAFFPVKDT